MRDRDWHDAVMKRSRKAQELGGSPLCSGQAREWGQKPCFGANFSCGVQLQQNHDHLEVAWKDVGAHRTTLLEKGRLVATKLG